MYNDKIVIDKFYTYKEIFIHLFKQFNCKVG